MNKHIGRSYSLEAMQRSLYSCLAYDMVGPAFVYLYELGCEYLPST